MEKQINKITGIIYRNSTDTSEGLLIRFENIEKVLKELEQLNLGVVSRSLIGVKTELKKWNEKNYSTAILYNGLNRYIDYEEEKGNVVYVEDITLKNFRKIKGLGRKSWHDFIDLRGY